MHSTCIRETAYPLVNISRSPHPSLWSPPFYSPPLRFWRFQISDVSGITMYIIQTCHLLQHGGTLRALSSVKGTRQIYAASPALTTACPQVCLWYPPVWPLTPRLGVTRGWDGLWFASSQTPSIWHIVGTLRTLVVLSFGREIWQFYIRRHKMFIYLDLIVSLGGSFSNEIFRETRISGYKCSPDCWSNWQKSLFKTT